LPKLISPLPAALLLLGLAACASGPQTMKGMVTVGPDSAPVTVPIIVEGDQILVGIDVVRPDGSTNPILADINMGGPKPYLQEHLYRDLQIGEGHAFSYRIGGIRVSVDGRMVIKMDDAAYPERQFWPFFFTHRVEAMLNAGILQQFEIALDYQDKTMTLASPGSLAPEGVPVPIHWNEDSGLVTVDLTVDGQRYPVVIDGGGGYTWVRPSVAAKFLAAHPDWQHAEGAVGPANYNMVDYAIEKQGTMIRIPEISIGPMPVHNLGAMATGPALGWPLDIWFREIVFDLWQKNAPEPVIGWLGANVLKHYRLTIDYRNRMSYWLKKSDFDPHELDQVGLTLVYEKGDYRIGGIVKKSGKPTVEGVEAGDKIIAIDDKPVAGWSRDQIFGALHGRAGDSHRLTIERDGKSMALMLPVTEF
jgi:hypothetical protein